MHYMVSLVDAFLGGEMMNGLATLQGFLQEESYEDAILISPINLHYFAGFTGTTGVALVTPNKAYMIMDSRYTEQAKEQCEGYEVVEYTGDVYETIRDLLKRSSIGLTTCCFEGNYMSVDVFQQVCDTLNETEFLSFDFASLRIVKREDELKYLRQAFNIADESFAAMLPQLKVGMTENEARIILETEMLRRGSKEPSFATIVASGYRSSMPHGVASDKVMERGDFVTFDFGAMYKGYHSDMTRTIVLGKASDEQKELYSIVLEAQQRGVASIKESVTALEIDSICRDYIKEQGYGSNFRHGTGHGVGLDIHELPVVSPKSKDILRSNMVVTVEPGIYLPGHMGLRIEDTVIVTKEGCEVLTKTPKDLIELDV